MGKKIGTWAVLIFVAYMLATNPHGVASFLESAQAHLKSAATAMHNLTTNL